VLSFALAGVELAPAAVAAAEESLAVLLASKTKGRSQCWQQEVAIQVARLVCRLGGAVAGADVVGVVGAAAASVEQASTLQVD